MSDDGSVKVYAKQYTSKAGNKYYWGRYQGYDVRIFKGKEHEGVPQLDVIIKQVAEDPPRDTSIEQTEPEEQDDGNLPF